MPIQRSIRKKQEEECEKGEVLKFLRWFCSGLRLVEGMNFDGSPEIRVLHFICRKLAEF